MNTTQAPETSSSSSLKPMDVQVETSTKRVLPNFLLSVKLKYVKLGYHYLITNAMYILLIPLLAVAFAHLSTLTSRTLLVQLTGSFSDENLAFQQKILERSGLGQNTYMPEAVLRVPPNPCMEEARKEAEMVMFGAIDELLEKTGVKPRILGFWCFSRCTPTHMP
ncbi:hypothetical protein M0R45_018258 [Rubus argutus]|uniref:FAE domain-containing protein n=1 Tax=Rubus argutus TaxID=59490 RepID=A0AAW1X2Y2_RUBAR